MQVSKPIALFFPFDLMSHYLRCLQLAEAIRDDFECVFLHSEQYAAFVENCGFGTMPGKTISAAEVVQQSKAFRFDWLAITALDEVFRSQRELILQLRPAMVVGDNSHTLKMAAAATHTPFVSVVNGYLSRYYAQGRPMPLNHPLVRYTGISARVFTPLVPVGERLAFWYIHRPFRRLRKKYGLPSLFTFEQELEGDLTCIVDSPLLFPQKTLPDHYRIIGPLYHREKRAEPAAERFLDPSKATVIVAMGSTGALAKVSWLTDPCFGIFNVVVAGADPAQFPAPHIFAAPFINMTAILPKADLVICHGGNGTINQALAAGVPVLCIPEFFEQEWNADRIDQLGYGQVLDTSLSVESRLDLLKSWIAQKNDPRFARLASTLQVEDTQKNFRQAVTEKYGRA